MPFRIAHINYLATSPQEQGAFWPWYSSTNVNRTTLPPETPLGAYWELQGNFAVGGGNAFMLVKNVGGALTLGDVVTWTAPAASTITAAGSTVNTLVWAAGGLTAGAEVGNLLYVANTASGGFQLRRILANTATTITIAPATGDPMVAATAAGVRVNGADALAAVPTNGDVAIIIRPYTVAINTATANVPVGVALGTVADGNYTVIQVMGYGLVRATNAGAALAVGAPAIASATSGVLTGTAAAGVLTAPGNFTSLAAYNAAGPTLQPFKINCFDNL